MNTLETGLLWLSRKLKQKASSKVTYRRGRDTFEVDAVFGRTEYETVNAAGHTIAAHSRDFLINADQLDFEPQIGDKIIVNGTTHDVLALGDTCWRWCDPHGITKRIHTRQL